MSSRLSLSQPWQEASVSPRFSSYMICTRTQRSACKARAILIDLSPVLPPYTKTWRRQDTGPLKGRHELPLFLSFSVRKTLCEAFVVVALEPYGDLQKSKEDEGDNGSTTVRWYNAWLATPESDYSISRDYGNFWTTTTLAQVNGCDREAVSDSLKVAHCWLVSYDSLESNELHPIKIQSQFQSAHHKARLV